MEKFLKQNGALCTGCSACFNACPVEAIQMEKNQYGFEKATIQQDKCIHCDLCKKVCPVLHVDKSNKKNPTSYAIWADDEIRKHSAAGGAFPLLAKAILEKRGVVYGAAFKNVTEVHHIIATNEQELLALQKSKYVQSHIGYIYRDVQKKLQEGKDVLFSGCPCQVAGLKAYLRKSYKNLFTVDLVCAGVPSSQMLRESLADVGGADNVEYVDFRNKDLGWDCSQLTVYMKDKRKRILPINEVPWEKQSQFEVAMHYYLAKNDACENCAFCDFPRQGDITIGDYWGIWLKDENWNDHKGTSMVLINSEKGQKLFDEIQGGVKRVEAVPWQEFARNRLQPKVSFNPNRQRFLSLYPQKSFNQAVKDAMSGWHDIGLIGNWNASNYGSHLTHYALYRILTGWNYSVLMIGSPQYAEWKNTGSLLFRKTPYPVWDMGKVAQTFQEMMDFNHYCGKFILGSDQLFDGYIFEKLGEFSALEWVSDSKPKISYATSFGYDELRGSDSVVSRMGHGISKFDALSVREKSGVKIMKETFHKDAAFVLEPVFLPSVDVYEEIMQSAEPEIPKGPYILVYMLDPSEYKARYARMLAEQNGWEIVFIIDAAKKYIYTSNIMGCASKEHVCVEDWLWYIKNSAMVITDSFHACCFSIVFHKQFLTLCNYGRGAARFFSLLGELDLTAHLVVGNTELPENKDQIPIDYQKVERKLAQWRENSLSWLETALLETSKKPKVESTYYLLEQRLQNDERQLEKVIQELKQINSQNQKQTGGKFARGIKCVKENGVRYTVKRVGQKIKNKLG